jgi:hypothetical protein
MEKYIKLFENFTNKQTIEFEGYNDIDWNNKEAVNEAFNSFLEKHFAGYIYHPVPTLSSSEMFIGLLVKPEDSTLSKSYAPQCLYWNNNYETVYVAPFPC